MSALLLGQSGKVEKRRLVIVGSGPAGYSAAVYAARAQLEPKVFTGEKSGGQLMLTTEVENYAGFPEGILGPELMLKMREQAERFGAEMSGEYITAVDFTSRPFKLWTTQPPEGTAEDLGLNGSKEAVNAALMTIRQEKHQIEAETVILATGAVSILLGVPGERDYLGRGVSTCAVCDAAFFRERDVFVVGGGDAAMEDILALVKFARKVTVIHRRDAFRASKIMQQRVLKEHKDKVDVWWNTEVREVKGNGTMIESIVVEDIVKSEKREVSAGGLFIAIGHKPMTHFLQGEVALDEKGYVVTRFGLHAPSLELAQAHVSSEGQVQFPTMTSVEGVFAAGDNVDFRYRQAITAAGYGCMAALDAEWWLGQ